jgi:general secretion pathway protein J
MEHAHCHDLVRFRRARGCGSYGARPAGSAVQCDGRDRLEGRRDGASDAVALVVFGFLMAGLTQGVQFGMRAWSMQARSLDAQNDVEAVDHTLRQLIERMAPAGPGDAALISGDSGRLAFTSELPMSMPSELRRADMVLGLDARRRLILRWVPHRHAVSLGPAPEPKETALINGVERLELAYWPRNGAGGWKTVWRDRDPPGLVRLRFVFAGGERRWPEIVVAPVRDSFAG